MKCGVEFSSRGQVEFNIPDELKKYVPLYREIIHQMVISNISVYSSTDYNIYVDPEFKKEVEKRLGIITEYLIDNKVFPDDILEYRRSKLAELEIVRDKELRYFGHINSSRSIANILPIHQEIFFATKRMKITTWRLLDGSPTNLYLFIIKTNKKLLTKKIITSKFNGRQSLFSDFESNFLISRTYGLDTIKTGIRVKLDTAKLSIYSPLRYILETEN